MSKAVHKSLHWLSLWLPVHSIAFLHIVQVNELIGQLAWGYQGCTKDLLWPIALTQWSPNSSPQTRSGPLLAFTLPLVHYYSYWYQTLTFPQTSTRGHYSSTDINDVAVFLTLDANDGAVFLPPKPRMEQYSSHQNQLWSSIPPTDNNNEAVILPLILMMGHDSSHWHL